MLQLLLCLLAGLWIGFCGPLSAEDRSPIRPELLLDRDAVEKVDTVQPHLHPDLLPLWKQALQQPESEIYRQVARAVVKAHQLKFPGLEQFKADFLRLLKQTDVHPAARYEIARALIELETREAAADLFTLSQKSSQDFRQLIEPALSRWEFVPIRAVWAERLKSKSSGRRDLILAIDGLVAAQSKEVLPQILALVGDALQPADIRLHAARGASLLTNEGLETEARRLFDKPAPKIIERLCAVQLIERHRSEAAVSIQQTLVADPEPAVVTTAINSLFQNDPQLVLPVAQVGLAHSDAMVRQVAIETFIKLPTVERMNLLARHLNDPHPVLRSMVREGYLTYSREPQYEAVILEILRNALAGDDWRGQEQASLLMAVLDRKEAAPRLVELLKSNRDEVMVASAWALRVLSVPETAPGILSQVQARGEQPSINEPGIGYQIAHMSEALAVLHHRPSLDVLRKFIPKTDKYHPVARAGAIYAIGMILEDVGQDAPPPVPQETTALSQAASLLGLKKTQTDFALATELCDELMERVRDVGSPNPEKREVRRAGGLAIGRMKMARYTTDMKKLVGETCSVDPPMLALRWAIHRISGELIPLTMTTPQEFVGWFLEPDHVPKPRTAP